MPSNKEYLRLLITSLLTVTTSSTTLKIPFILVPLTPK